MEGFEKSFSPLIISIYKSLNINGHFTFLAKRFAAVSAIQSGFLHVGRCVGKIFIVNHKIMWRESEEFSKE